MTGYLPPRPRPGAHRATSALCARKDYGEIIRPTISNNLYIAHHRHYPAPIISMMGNNLYIGHCRHHRPATISIISDNPWFGHHRHYPARTIPTTLNSARIAHCRYHRNIMPPAAATLLPLEPKRRWTGSTAIAVADAPACVWCGTWFEAEHTQPALFYHGGYGAAQRRLARWCLCGAVGSVDLADVNPRNL